MAGAITFNFWPPYLKEIGLSLEYIGYLVSFATLTIVITPLLIKKIIKLFGNGKKTLVVFYGLETILLLLLAIKFPLLIIVLIYYLFFVISNTGTPIFNPFF